MTGLLRLPVSLLERPRCPGCQMRMMLARTEYRKNGSEKRIFECLKCHSAETKIVDDPLKSSALARLADSVRPPS
jgi:hypothetical protein